MSSAQSSRPIHEQGELITALPQRSRALLERREDRRSTRGNEPLHQQDKERRRVPPLALGGVPAATHIVGYGFVELPFQVPVGVGRDPDGGLAGLEQHPAGAVDRLALLRAHDVGRNRGASDRLPVHEPVVEQPEEPPEPVALTRVRCRRQQQDMWRDCGELDRELVAGDILARTGHVVGLVDDHHVPARVKECPEPGCIVGFHLLGTPTRSPPKWLDRVERAHHLVERTPRVDTAVYRQPFGPDTNEFLSEAICHLGDPLELDTFGGDHDDPLKPSSGLHLGEDRPGRDGLAEADLVADGEPHRVHPEGAFQGG